MRRIIGGLLLAAVAATGAADDPCDAPATTVVLVRHAEREPDKDQLSAAGQERASKLALMLRDAGVKAIIHTQYERTRATAAPVAAALGVTAIEIDARDDEAVAHAIHDGHRGETVLVIGHSNTVPGVVAALGGPGIPDFAEDDFGKLLVLNLCGCTQQATLTELRY